ncbi:MAG: VOC family protein [Sphingobacteriales bacterium]|nr:VOC family protein [Sphingobacteriales bacterium]
MEAKFANTVFGAQFVQIAWVVKDINAALKFFREVMGVDSFGEPVIIRAKDYEATCYGKPSDAETLTSIAYSGGTFIELIQPLSGNSVFHDYLDKNPAGGIQHVAYRIPVEKLDKVISGFADKGFPVVSRFNTPPAQIVFFDTSKEIGVMTEIMGITKEGEAMVEKMKSGKF